MDIKIMKSFDCSCTGERDIKTRVNVFKQCKGMMEKMKMTTTKGLEYSLAHCHAV